MSFFAELKRRNVFRVGAAYVVAAWLLIQVAETIFPLFGYGDTPARIVVVVLAIGLVPTMIFAWAFELTPEGLKRESEVDRSQSITPHTAKKLDRIIMVSLALGYFAFDKFVLDPQRDFASEAQKVTEVEQARQAGRTEALVTRRSRTSRASSEAHPQACCGAWFFSTQDAAYCGRFAHLAEDAKSLGKRSFAMPLQGCE